MKFKIVEAEMRESKEKCFEIFIFKQSHNSFKWVSLKELGRRSNSSMQFLTKESARQYMEIKKEKPFTI